MQTRTERSLNEIFDTDPAPKDPEKKTLGTELESVPDYHPAGFVPDEERENAELKSDMADDYDIARSNYKELIRQGESLLELVMSTAQATEDPKHIDAASKVIGQLAGLNSRLLELTQRKQDVYNKTRTTEVIRNALNGDPSSGKTLVQNNNSTVTNNVQFVGTAADLMKLIKDVKNEETTDKRLPDL